MKGKKKSKDTEDLLEEQQRIIKKIGERIKQFRIERGHSSYEIFAFEHDIDRSQYGKYERGADMRLSSLIKVFSALDVTFEEFFGKGFHEL